jgi:hypothetical protein
MSQAHNYNVLIIILCSLYDRIVLHILHLTVFSFFEVISIIFQAIQKHLGKQCASEVSQLKEIIRLSSLIYRPNYLIRITLKMNIHRLILIWWPIYRASLLIIDAYGSNLFYYKCGCYSSLLVLLSFTPFLSLNRFCSQVIGG